MVNGDRVRQVRELLGWTQTALAERLGVDQARIAKIEKGDLRPSESLMQRLALQTGFPAGFFDLPDGPDFPMGSLLFRAHAAATVRDRMEAYRYGQIIYEMTDRLAAKVKLLPLRVPQLTEPSAMAARITRSSMGLSPDTPIPALLNVIERAGVLVIALPVDLDERDAFSLWAGPDSARRPVVFVSAGRPGDRLRWSISHEVAHLVLHPAIRGQISDAEKEADSFAAEFLMPEVAMRRELYPPITLALLARLKSRWRVSIQSLARRAFELELITRRQYTYLFEQIAARGWRVREPIDVPVEKPRALKKMAELVYGNPIQIERLASDMSLSTRFVRSVIDAHADRQEFASGRAIDAPANASRAARIVPLRRRQVIPPTVSRG